MIFLVIDANIYFSLYGILTWIGTRFEKIECGDVVSDWLWWVGGNGEKQEGLRAAKLKEFKKVIIFNWDFQFWLLVTDLDV